MPSEYEILIGLKLVHLVEKLDPEKDFDMHLTANLLFVEAQKQVENELKEKK